MLNKLTKRTIINPKVWRKYQKIVQDQKAFNISCTTVFSDLLWFSKDFPGRHDQHPVLYPGQNSNYDSPWFFSFLRWIKSFSFFSLTLFSSEGRASGGKILKGDREFLRLCKNIQLLSNSNTLVWEFHIDKNNSLYSLRLRTGRYSSSGGRGGERSHGFQGEQRGISRH